MEPAKASIRSTGPEKPTILKLSIFAVLTCGISAWTYHHDSTLMRWEIARKWCQNKFTDMVFVRSKNESNYLNKTVPGGAPYYWIGIQRNKNGTWIWDGTKKPVPEDIISWATGEPSAGQSEVCVELYINRLSESGKWNNERCDKKKRPLCYQDSCKDSTCSQHGECIEDIGKYTCVCWPGFRGNNCERAVPCVDLQIPANGEINCSDEYERSQYKSFCNFTCDEGYVLHGANSVFCQHTGEWSELTPTCLAVTCGNLQIPVNGKTNCINEYGKFQYKSFCNFSCDEGYELHGANSVFCQHTGEWSELTPTCLAVTCENLKIPVNGKINCIDEYGKFQYKSFCNFSCDEGYELNGTKSVFCQNTGEWSEPTPTCLAWNVSLKKQKQVTIISSVLGTVGLFSSGIPIVYILSHLRKKKKENSQVIKANIEPPNTFENPAFEDTEMNSLDL